MELLKRCCKTNELIAVLGVNSCLLPPPQTSVVLLFPTTVPVLIRLIASTRGVTLTGSEY